MNVVLSCWRLAKKDLLTQGESFTDKLLIFAAAASCVRGFTSQFSTATASSPLSPMLMPNPPYPYLQKECVRLDLAALGSRVVAAEERRQHGFDTSRKIQITLVKAQNSLERSAMTSSTTQPQHEGEELDSLLDSMSLLSPSDRTPREANLSYRIEELVQYKAFSYFLKSGKLLPQSSCLFATDEEYLSGACMGLAQDLSRYGMGRATARDVESVSCARNLCLEILEELLQFDFRNGPLRRKYDGTKYALRKLETILYELAVTGTPLPTSDTSIPGPSPIVNTDEPEQKRVRSDSQPSQFFLLDKEEMKSLRHRVHHRDELREVLIKKCRDAQKAAKQSIFAMHRGDRQRAASLLQLCETNIIQELVPIVHEDPQLRSGGSFSSVLEEYAEAKLFFTWLYGNDQIPTTSSSSSGFPVGILLSPNDALFFASNDAISMKLEPEEYLGGLCDLTGEVGRFAVQRGTARDIEGVKLCLETNVSILTAIQLMERMPPGMGKKMDVLRNSVEKLERILYEMSLSEAAGGRNVEHSMMDIDREAGHGDEGETTGF